MPEAKQQLFTIFRQFLIELAGLFLASTVWHCDSFLDFVTKNKFQNII
jgi:hypothetical protein